jgi:hypothetical protein
LTFMRLKAQDCKDISEDDYNLLRVLFPIYHDGGYPIYVAKMEGLPDLSVQNSLFDAIKSDELSGEQGGIFFDKGFEELNEEDNEKI